MIGILTKDVRLYYDLIIFLKSRRIQFRMLDFDRKIPRDIGVVLTSQDELEAIDFEPKIAVTDLEADVRRARQVAAGMERAQELVVGVDPGPMPGIAAISQGKVIETAQAQNPAHAADIIFGILSDYSYSQCVLKIGHGAPEERDQLIELVGGSFDRVEIVDEASTSRAREGHEDSAVRIARG